MNHFSFFYINKLADVSVFNVSKKNTVILIFSNLILMKEFILSFFLMDLLFSKVNVILDHLDRMS